MKYTPLERVLRALRRESVDVVPFTMYEYKVPQNAVEREMRNRGMCIVDRKVPVYRTHRPNVKVKQETFWEKDKKFIRTWLETPAGTLTALDEPAGFTTWHHEKFFKSPDDYKALLFFVEDIQYEAYYDEWVIAEKAAGGDCILRANIGLEPLQAFISGNLMSMEDYCIQWLDNQDEILKLYRAMVEKHRQLYPILAESPAYHINYGGNVVQEVVGIKVFRKYFVPHYNEAAEILHKRGKLIGCHFDSNNKHIAPAIAETELDFIEAFTPAPDTDMTLADAREIWRDKVLWLNFPSSVHLKPDAEVEEATVALLEEIDSVEGLLMGITEDIPPERELYSCRAIMDGLERHAREHPELYG